MKLFNLILCYSLIMLPSVTFAKEGDGASSEQYKFEQLVLPSEVKSMSKNSGAIYYSPTVKNKVLVPAHFWGEVDKSGLHFIPVDTSLVQGLSLAGGAKGEGKLEDVVVSRPEGGKNKEYHFNLSAGGDDKAHAFKLKAGDTVFVEKDRFYSNRAYYTSLIGIVVTVLSGVLIYRQVARIPQ